MNKQRRQQWARTAYKKASEQTQADIREIVEALRAGKACGGDKLNHLAVRRRWTLAEAVVVADICKHLETEK